MPHFAQEKELVISPMRSSHPQSPRAKGTVAEICALRESGVAVGSHRDVVVIAGLLVFKPKAGSCTRCSPLRGMAEPAIEIVPDRLYWQSFRGYPEPQQGVHFFSTDDLLVYDPYYGDFGPLNTSQIVRFMRMLNDKMRAAEAEKKKIVYFCRANADTRANSALLLSAWNMIYRNKSPTEAFAPFAAVRTPFVPFRDASLGPPTFHLTISHCLAGLHKAIECGFFDPETFDCDEYEYYERVENGDFNWIVPGKFLAFSGPTQTPISYVDGVKTNTPETYFEYFRENNVTGVVRFNNKVYDRKKFLDAGARATDTRPPATGLRRLPTIDSARTASVARSALALLCCGARNSPRTLRRTPRFPLPLSQRPSLSEPHARPRARLGSPVGAQASTTRTCISRTGATRQTPS